MGKIIIRSNQNHREYFVLGLFISFLFLAQNGDAYEFQVGGSDGWTIPNDLNALNYNQWAERNRFQIGDTLVFEYPANKDTVVQVTKEDYNNCHSATPIKIFTDGHTVFKFNQSGPFYFISGLKENCLKNEKLVVVVMADRSKRSAFSNETIIAPSPSAGSPEIIPTITPSPTESTVITPSPPPATLEPQSPPPVSSVEESSPPPNGASSIVIGIIGSIGAFIVTLVLFGF